jgi:hypothetical protein
MDIKPAVAALSRWSSTSGRRCLSAAMIKVPDPVHHRTFGLKIFFYSERTSVLVPGQLPDVWKLTSFR